MQEAEVEYRFLQDSPLKGELVKEVSDLEKWTVIV
jgi:hypothetical protein